MKTKARKVENAKCSDQKLNDCLAVAAIERREVIAHAKFSPGPWWGFNGVQSLILTDSQLVRVKLRWGGSPKKVLDRLPLDEIRDASYRLSGRDEGKFVHLTISAKRKRRFTSKHKEGLALAKRLRAVVHGDEV